MGPLCYIARSIDEGTKGEDGWGDVERRRKEGMYGGSQCHEKVTKGIEKETEEGHARKGE